MSISRYLRAWRVSSELFNAYPMRLSKFSIQGVPDRIFQYRPPRFNMGEARHPPWFSSADQLSFVIHCSLCSLILPGCHDLSPISVVVLYVVSSSIYNWPPGLGSFSTIHSSS